VMHLRALVEPKEDALGPFLYREIPNDMSMASIPWRGGSLLSFLCDYGIEGVKWLNAWVAGFRASVPPSSDYSTLPAIR
jgi:hypothetical protein